MLSFKTSFALCLRAASALSAAAAASMIAAQAPANEPRPKNPLREVLIAKGWTDEQPLLKIMADASGETIEIVLPGDHHDGLEDKFRQAMFDTGVPKGRVEPHSSKPGQFRAYSLLRDLPGRGSHRSLNLVSLSELVEGGMILVSVVDPKQAQGWQNPDYSNNGHKGFGAVHTWAISADEAPEQLSLAPVYSSWAEPLVAACLFLPIAAAVAAWPILRRPWKRPKLAEGLVASALLFPAPLTLLLFGLDNAARVLTVWFFGEPSLALVGVPMVGQIALVAAIALMARRARSRAAA